MVKRSFVEIENNIIRLVKDCPRKDWELAEALGTGIETIRRRTIRIQERGAMQKVNELWHWLPPERRL